MCLCVFLSVRASRREIPAWISRENARRRRTCLLLLLQRLKLAPPSVSPFLSLSRALCVMRRNTRISSVYIEI